MVVWRLTKNQLIRPKQTQKREKTEAKHIMAEGLHFDLQIQVNQYIWQFYLSTSPLIFLHQLSFFCSHSFLPSHLPALSFPPNFIPPYYWQSLPNAGWQYKDVIFVNWKSYIKIGNLSDNEKAWKENDVQVVIEDKKLLVEGLWYIRGKVSVIF